MMAAGSDIRRTFDEYTDLTYLTKNMYEKILRTSYPDVIDTPLFISTAANNAPNPRVDMATYEKYLRQQVPLLTDLRKLCYEVEGYIIDLQREGNGCFTRTFFNARNQSKQVSAKHLLGLCTDLRKIMGDYVSFTRDLRTGTVIRDEEATEKAMVKNIEAFKFEINDGLTLFRSHIAANRNVWDGGWWSNRFSNFVRRYNELCDRVSLAQKSQAEKPSEVYHCSVPSNIKISKEPITVTAGYAVLEG